MLAGDRPNRFLPQRADRTVGSCREAQTFAAFLAEYVTPFLQQRLAPNQIAMLKLLALDKFQELRRNLPADHNNRFTQQPHRCVAEQFQATYDALHMLSLAAQPPDLTDAEWMVKQRRRKKTASPRQEDVDAALNELILGQEES